MITDEQAERFREQGFLDILVVHSSPAATSGLRRVLSYAFRPIAIERQRGPTAVP